MSFFRNLAQMVVPPPEVRPEVRIEDIKPTTRTITQKPISGDIEEIKDDLIFDIEEIKDDLIFDEVDHKTTDSVSLCSLGESIQDALDKYGIVKKTNMEASIFLEDLSKSSSFNLFYFTYSKTISPADFINLIQKETSTINVNLGAVIICDAIQLKFVSDGVGVIIVSGGM